jgi:hypothetical protein
MRSGIVTGLNPEGCFGVGVRFLRSLPHRSLEDGITFMPVTPAGGSHASQEKTSEERSGRLLAL